MANMDDETRDEIIGSINETREDMTKSNNIDRFKGWTRTILYNFIDTDDFFSFEVVDGAPGPIVEGEIESPDIRIRMSSETMLKLIRGQLNGMVAFTTGKVKVKASMSDFSKLQKLFS